MERWFKVGGDICTRGPQPDVNHLTITRENGKMYMNIKLEIVSSDPLPGGVKDEEEEHKQDYWRTLGQDDVLRHKDYPIVEVIRLGAMPDPHYYKYAVKLTINFTGKVPHTVG